MPDLSSFSIEILREFTSSTAVPGRPSQRDLDHLIEKLDRLSLVAMAIWSIARDKLGATDAELAERIQALDLADGKLDGRMNSGVVECRKCHRKLSARHGRCLYCGTERPSGTA